MAAANEPAPTVAPAEEPGAPLMVPAEEAERLRRRRERPAEIGRYALLGLGAVCATAGAALWLTTPGVSLPAVAFLAFGLTLMALGGTLHLLLVRDRDRWPEQVHAWADGIELLLHDGELRAASWDDPKLALDLYVQPRRGSSYEDHLLVWRMGSSVPPCDLSEAGFSRFMEMVVAHKLRLDEFRNGKRTREARAYVIRARPEHPAPGSRSRGTGESHPAP